VENSTNKDCIVIWQERLILTSHSFLPSYINSDIH
jgi:hypothetical protein